MKKVIYILMPVTAIAIMCLLQACKKNNDYPSRVVTVSYPVVTLNGPADTTISRGTNWVDPGASWKDTVTGESGILRATINTSVDSAYYIVYIATNKNGFSNAFQSDPVTRGVGVTNMNNTIDISGTYTTNGLLGSVPGVQVSKVSRALFSSTSVDGLLDPGVIVIKSDSTISVATLYPNNANIASFFDNYATPYFTLYISPASIPEVFTGTSIIYQAPYTTTGNPPHLTGQSTVVMNYTATPLNASPMAVNLSRNPGP